ncbi:hypothetical protein KEJ47_00215 [Candidatus Bathyarchaeota archaeon]|nr:hypothetical protein [Candidatus Bathyarchaeota archaeon]
MSREVGRLYLLESILGVFGINAKNEILVEIFYPWDPTRIADALTKQAKGEITEEVRKAVEKSGKIGFTELVFSNRNLALTVKNRMGLDVQTEEENPALSFLASSFEEIARRQGKDTAQFYELNHQVSLLLARGAVSESISKRESLIIQAVHLLNELDKSLNSLSSVLKEWYGLHFPELNRLIDDNRTYALVVKAFGGKMHIDSKKLAEIGVQQAERILRASKESMGTTLSDMDLHPIRQLSEHLLTLHDYRKDLEDYIASLVMEVSPNLSEVAGPLLAAKLLEKAKGLRKLSVMPSSRIQLLGAEKAMFRALKTGSKPPKHGLVFQHQLVHNSPKKFRGRVARLLSAKISLAARADYFSGRSIIPQLKEELAKITEAIKKTR